MGGRRRPGAKPVDSQEGRRGGLRAPPSASPPRISDAELVTPAVMQALLGFTSKARWVRQAHARVGSLPRTSRPVPAAHPPDFNTRLFLPIAASGETDENELEKH